MIAFTSLMFRTSPVYQLAMTLLVVFASYVLQVRNVPYMSGKDFDQVVEEHQTKVKEGDKLHIRIQCTIDETKAKNSSQSSAGQGWEAQQRILKEKRGYYLVSERIVQYLTDFNTVESILLASAILVNLCGIMFLSSRFDGDSLQHYRSDFETLGVLCMIVVCTSFVYWILVFGFEMLSTFWPKKAVKLVAACSCRGPKVSASSTSKGTKLGTSESRANRKRRSKVEIEMQNNPLSAMNLSGDIPAFPEVATHRVKELETQLESAHSELYRVKQSLEVKSSKGASTQYALGKQKQEFPQYKSFRSNPIKVPEAGHTKKPKNNS